MVLILASAARFADIPVKSVANFIRNTLRLLQVVESLWPAFKALTPHSIHEYSGDKIEFRNLTKAVHVYSTAEICSGHQ